MKHLLASLTFLLWSFVSNAADTTIVFRDIRHADLFETAKKEHKGVMLYFHFDGCGACVQMEKTAFKDAKVIDLFNQNFVNFEINTRKGEGIETNKIYNIQLHPTFIFFDQEGSEIHRMVGTFRPEEFYHQAHGALYSQQNLTSYKALHHKGNREPDFLYDYAYMLRDAYALDSNVVNEYLDAIDSKDYSLEKNIKFIYEFCIHHNRVFIPFDNPRFNFMISNKNLFYAHLDSNQINTRIVWILNRALYEAIEKKDESTFSKALKWMEEYDTGEPYYFQEMDGRITGMITTKHLVLTSQLAYYDKMGDKSNYLKTRDTYTSKIWNDADELNNFAWDVFQQAPKEDSEKIHHAIKCSIRSIELNNNYANNDTYAWLLYKSGDKENALVQAIKAIEIAKKNNENHSETQKLVDTIQQKN